MTPPIRWHMHLGLSDWAATEAALAEVVAGPAEHGERVDRFGLCLSRSMSLPEAERAGVAKETGPRLDAGDWARVTSLVVEPHLGDFMIGTYNGGALDLGRRLTATLAAVDHRPAVVFGGILNEDDGGPLPVDARPGLQALGVRCVDAIEDLPAALA